MIVLILKPLESLNYILLFYLGVIGVHFEVLYTGLVEMHELPELDE